MLAGTYVLDCNETAIQPPQDALDLVHSRACENRNSMSRRRNVGEFLFRRLGGVRTPHDVEGGWGDPSECGRTTCNGQRRERAEQGQPAGYVSGLGCTV